MNKCEKIIEYLKEHLKRTQEFCKKEKIGIIKMNTQSEAWEIEFDDLESSLSANIKINVQDLK